MPRAGQYRHIIQIQSKTRAVDAVGGYTETYSTITDGERPAWISPVSSGERFEGQQLQEQVTHKIGVRHLSTVTTGMRVLFGARVFEILSKINPFERGIELVLLCIERVAV